MKKPDLSKPDKWITNRLRSSGIDEEALLQKKIYWFASLSVSIMIAVLVITYHLIFPDLKILIWYGLFLIFIFMQGVIIPLLFRLRGISVWWQFVNQTLVAIATFIAVILMGGIPYSGGLILVGLALVFFSLNFRKKSATIAIFVIHIISVVFMAVLHPWLTVAPEMTPAVNISLYAINIIWISAFAFAFVMNFISQRIKLEKNETEKFKELNHAMSRLYTNITHEFRTPLTVIKSMTDLIREQPDKWTGKGLEKIDRNADQLLYLVNQMLALAKLEAGVMPVNMISSNINQQVRYIIEMHESLAAARQIELVYMPCNEDPVMDFEPEKLTTIISNLLNNALKFTARHGKIIVQTEIIKNETFIVRVIDNGPGIPPGEIGHIFDRFYRVQNDQTFLQPGSGLGLSLVSEMVKLLEGDIQVESELGMGTTFIVRLPIRRMHPFGEIAPPSVKMLMGTIQNAGKFASHADVIEDLADEDKPVLLIVEDNMDVTEYLSHLLGSGYQILIAEDGKKGFEKAVHSIPDLIISDIMMPVMDGIEMLDKLKNDIHTSHIPVIMLTARADIDSKLEGLETGADAYLSKPFDKNELLTRISALITLRKKLRERYSNIDNSLPPGEKKYRYEDAFMKKIRESMLSNLHDESFDINHLCQEVGMSRTQLYRKFKSLSNQTISTYLRTLRLSKAREMLLEGTRTVSEVAYHTGFKNLSHFSKAFKSEFKVNPSEVHN